MKKLLSLMFILAASISCTEDNLEPEGNFQGPKVVGFGTSFESVAHFADIGVVERTFPVNLIGLGNGSTSPEPIEVSYTIDAANTTAVEGVEFNFADTSGKVTIPAGGTFGLFPLNVNTGNFNPTEKTQLVLKLTSATGETVVGEQYNSLRIVFVGCQSELATPEGTSYTAVVTSSTGFVRTYPNEIVTLTDVNTFHTQNTGTFTSAQLAPATDTGFDFIDICGDITVPSQNLASYWGNIVKGLTTDGTDGSVADPNTFTIVYEISFSAGNRTYTAVYTRNN